MKIFNEKEKKLQKALDRLSNLSISNRHPIDKISVLQDQKNQLEIEKSDLLEKYSKLENEFDDLKLKISHLHDEK